MDSIYGDILTICEKYLSKDSQKFLDRQISAHLKKTPQSITQDDGKELAKWSKVSGELLMGPKKAELMAGEIFALLSKNGS
ncbi:MAG: hypothetical protein V3S82_01635 [Dehalococcoidia bacterium]